MGRILESEQNCMHKRNQLIVVVSVLVLMGVLLFQPIKGLINPPDESAAQASSDSHQLVTFQSESQRAKQGLNPAIIQEITELEARLARADDGDEKLDLLRQLAEKWDDIDKQAPQGFIYQELAQMTNRSEDWLKAGNAYRAAYSAVQDTSIAFPLIDFAVHAYQQVLDADPDNLDAKTGLGAAYVSGGAPSPMAGIALLQEVVKADPDHLEANRSLGLFSMQSRQFDRAIERFQTVIAQQPDAESYFYLATSYENIGLNQEAIKAFEKSKQLAADPTLNQFIDRKIEELSK